MKNQPTIHAEDEVPTEDYHALWDGETLMVAWEAMKIGWGGGHVVADIIEKAATRAQCGLYVQACNPSCDHMFVHCDVALTLTPDGPRWEVGEIESMIIEVDARGEPSVDTALEVAWRHLRTSFRDFAMMKNAARNVLDLEALVRYDLDRVTTLHYEMSGLSQQPWIPALSDAWRLSAWKTTRLPALWVARHWRRTSRLYLSQLWVGLGALEFVRRGWADAAARFEREVAEVGVEPLFSIDSGLEQQAVRDLDVSLIQSSIEHAAARLDASAVTRATLGGALAGAVVAGVISLIH